MVRHFACFDLDLVHLYINSVRFDGAIFSSSIAFDRCSGRWVWRRLVVDHFRRWGWAGGRLDNGRSPFLLLNCRLKDNTKHSFSPLHALLSQHSYKLVFLINLIFWHVNMSLPQDKWWRQTGYRTIQVSSEARNSQAHSTWNSQIHST